MHVTGIATISIDGRITPPGQEGTPFASPETGSHFFAQLREHDVSVSGRRTFDAVREMMVNALRHEADVPKNVVWTREPAAHAGTAIAGRLEFTDLRPEAIVAQLEAEGHRRLLVAGGGQVYAAFAAAGLIDEWFFAVEPVLLGGGTPLLSETATSDLVLRSSRLLNDDTTLLHYKVVRAEPAREIPDRPI